MLMLMHAYINWVALFMILVNYGICCRPNPVRKRSDILPIKGKEKKKKVWHFLWSGSHKPYWSIVIFWRSMFSPLGYYALKDLELNWHNHRILGLVFCMLNLTVFSYKLNPCLFTFYSPCDAFNPKHIILENAVIGLLC